MISVLINYSNLSTNYYIAWNGDKYLVRYLLGKGADRKKIGTFHSSKGIASKEFDGMNAEGWARERGHSDVADLINIGL